MAGSLRPFELVALVERIAASGFEGILRLAFPDEEVRVFFVGGLARYCAGTGKKHSLAAWLFRHKKMTQPELRSRLKVARAQKVSLEAILVRAGVVDEPELLVWQCQNAREVFGEACLRGPVSWTLDPRPPPPVVERFRLEPVRAMCEFVRRHDKRDYKAALGAFLAKRLVGTGALGKYAGEAHLALGAPVLALRGVMEAGTTVGEIGDRDLLRTIWALWRAGLLRFVDDLPSGAPVGSGVAPTAAECDAPVEPLAESKVVVSFAGATLATRGVPAVEVSGLPELLARAGYPIGAAALAEPGTPAALAEIEAEPGPPESGPPEPGILSAVAGESAPDDVSGEIAFVRASDIREGQDLPDRAGEPVVAAKLPGGVGLTELMSEAVAAATAAEERQSAEALALGDPAGPDAAVAKPAAEVSASRDSVPIDLKTWPPALAADRKAPEDPMLAAIFEVRKKLYESNHFEVLHIRPGAPLSAVMDAMRLLKAKYDPTAYMGTYMTPQSRNDLDVINKVLDKVVAELVDPPRRRVLEREHGGMAAAVVESYFRAHERYRDGRGRMDAGEFEAAKAAFDEAARLNPDDPHYHLWRARARHQLHRSGAAWAEADQRETALCLLEAMRLKPQFEEAQMEQAALYVAWGRAAEALAVYREIVHKNPRHTEARRAARRLEQAADGGGDTGPLGGRLGGLLGRLKKK